MGQSGDVDAVAAIVGAFDQVVIRARCVVRVERLQGRCSKNSLRIRLESRCDATACAALPHATRRYDFAVRGDPEASALSRLSRLGEHDHPARNDTLEPVVMPRSNARRVDGRDCDFMGSIAILADQVRDSGVTTPALKGGSRPG